MTLDRHVVGRVGERHLRLVGPQHTVVVLGFQRVAAQQAMVAKKKKIAHLGHRRGRIVNLWQVVFFIDPLAAQMDVDLSDLKAADFQIDLRFKFQKIGEFEAERRAVPCGNPRSCG